MLPAHGMLQDWQVLSPQLLKYLQQAGVPVEVVQGVSGAPLRKTRARR